MILYFFIRKDSHPSFNDDYCVFLKLSIALKAAHYDVCLRSKIAELKNVFQAKVGWLTGNMYSRVGTPDIGDHYQDPNEYKKTFFDEVLYRQSIWLSPEQQKVLRENLKTKKPNDVEEAITMLSGIPDLRTIFSEKLADQLSQAGLLADKGSETIDKVKNLISNNAMVKRRF